MDKNLKHKTIKYLEENLETLTMIMPFWIQHQWHHL
jgi:hypothetical protein